MATRHESSVHTCLKKEQRYSQAGGGCKGSILSYAYTVERDLEPLDMATRLEMLKAVDEEVVSMATGNHIAYSELV